MCALALRSTPIYTEVEPESRVRVLVVEDDPEDFQITRSLLSEMSSPAVDVSWASSFDSALAELPANRHRIALVDYSLGRRNGVELLQNATAAGWNGVAIFLSDHNEPAVQEQALESGAMEFLQKANLRADILAVAIRSALRLSEQVAQSAIKEQQFDLAMRASKEGFWDWDLDNGRAFFSESWKAMIGYGKNELRDDIEEWFSRVHPEDQPRLRAVIHAQESGLVRRFQNEYRIRHSNGNYRLMISRSVAHRGTDGRIHHVAGWQSDATEKRIAEQTLREQALYDPLTGVLNSSLLSDRLNRSVQRARRVRSYSFVVMYVNVDDLRSINHAHGYLVGDEVLRVVAGRLKQSLRSCDTVARQGSDDFIVVLEDVENASTFERLAHRIRKVLHAPIDVGGLRLHVTCSIGTASSRTGNLVAHQLIQEAELNMCLAQSETKTMFSLRSSNWENNGTVCEQH